MSSFDIDRNIVFQRRKGTLEDPFVEITEQVTIINGQAVLMECVDSFNGMVITKGGVEYNSKEIKQVKYDETLPDATTFIYSSEYGILYADTLFNNQVFTVSYYGTGAFYLNSKRVYTLLDNDGNVIATLDNLISDGKLAIQAIGGLEQAIGDAEELNTALLSDISTATTKHDNLLSSISTATTSKTNLDSSISTASSTKTALDSSNTIANTTKTNLDASISSANLSKTNLDSSISTGNTLKTNLDSSISSGNTTNSNLESSISIATTKKSDLDSSISTSATSKSNLDASISTASSTKTALDSSNTTANQTKISLDQSNTTANTTKTNLDSSISTASSTKTALDGSISTGSTLKTNLDSSISSGNTTYDNLNSSISTATTKKSDLDSSISSANTANGILTGTVESANTSIDELNQTNNAIIVWEEYNATHDYVPLNKVVYNGSSYICKQACKDVLPTNSAYWQLISAKGTNGLIVSVTSSNGDIETSEIDGNVTLTLNSGNGENQIPKLDSSGKLNNSVIPNGFAFITISPDDPKGGWWFKEI